MMEPVSIVISFPKDTVFETGQKVSAIKAVRGIARIGLKEAKELIDVAQTGREVECDCAVTDSELREYTETLRHCGATVNENTGRYELYIEQLKEITTSATLAGDYYVAKKILDLLETSF